MYSKVLCAVFLPISGPVSMQPDHHHPTHGKQTPRLASRHSTYLISLLWDLITEVLGYLF